MEQTEFFSGYPPNFILPKTVELEKILESQKNESILEKYIKSLYDNYISKNKFIFFFSVFIILMLLYRCFFDKNLEKMARPTFNPYYPINKQINYANYAIPAYQENMVQHPTPKPGQIFKNTLPNYGSNQINTTLYQRYNNDYKNPFMEFADQKSLENLSTYYN